MPPLSSPLISLAACQMQQRRKKEAEWLSAVSHMMRTHLNGILGMTQLVESTYPNSEQRLCLSMIKAKTHAAHTYHVHAHHARATRARSMPVTYAPEWPHTLPRLVARAREPALDPAHASDHARAQSSRLCSAPPLFAPPPFHSPTPAILRPLPLQRRPTSALNPSSTPRLRAPPSRQRPLQTSADFLLIAATDAIHKLDIDLGSVRADRRRVAHARARARTRARAHARAHKLTRTRGCTFARQPHACVRAPTHSLAP
eukprot:6195881-Pleurochrysis_carterae.AAC.2